MKWRVKRITEVVRAYDSSLFAVQASNGMIQIHRRADKPEAADYIEELPDLASHQPQFILALTDNWTLQGKPVEWGLDPIWRKITSMDSWRDEREFLGKYRHQKIDREKSDQDRQRRNEIRARAADMRKDFARATNDINTSSLSKLDSRRH